MKGKAMASFMAELEMRESAGKDRKVVLLRRRAVAKRSEGRGLE